ncbi:MAG: protein kinase domain-containing protein [Phycisphaerae bacterium]
MKPESFRAADELFGRLIVLPPDEHERVIMTECVDRPEVASLVRDLLRRELSRPNESETSTLLWPTVHTKEAASTVGLRIGEYRIIEQIGEGGMGTVYKAEHVATRQLVALKLIRASLAGPSYLPRFALEREILAQLQHEGIARMLYAGTSDSPSGPIPYLVMEFVEGTSVIDYANARHLNVRERVQLMARIADAVHYAHQRTIIHRDLKPANIMISMDGTPKVLDFGVARILSRDQRVTQVNTGIGHLIGTLAYMSPEQAGGDVNSVDTLSDVYALGVILFELLTGQLPYHVDSKSLPEALRIIREEEPSKLSRVSRGLRGDLDIIVGKALAKERSKRYASADAFAADLRRYLNNEPISARPLSFAYAWGKYARRNRTTVSAIASIFLISITAAIVSFGQMRRAEVERERAESESRLARELQVAEAVAREDAVRALDRALLAETTEKERAEQLAQVVELQTRILGQIDVESLGNRIRSELMGRAASTPDDSVAAAPVPPGSAEFVEQSLARVNMTDLARSVIAGSIVQSSEKAIADLADQAIRGKLYFQLASALRQIGELKDALRLYESAMELLCGFAPESDPYFLGTVHLIGSAKAALGDSEGARRQYTQVLELCASLGLSETGLAADVLHDLSELQRARGELADAEKSIRTAIGIRERVGDPRGDRMMVYQRALASILLSGPHFLEGEALQRELLEDYEYSGKPHTRESLTVMTNLISGELRQGNRAAAEDYARRAADGFARLLGEEHSLSLTARNNVAAVLQVSGRSDEALQIFREVYDRTARQLGRYHADTLRSAANVGFVLMQMGKSGEAEPILRQNFEDYVAVVGEMHSDALSARFALGEVLRRNAQLAEAEFHARAALYGRSVTLGDCFPLTVRSMMSVASILAGQRRFVEGEALFLQAYEARVAPEYSARFLTDVMTSIAAFYDSWDVIEPDGGHDITAESWRAMLAPNAASR